MDIMAIEMADFITEMKKSKSRFDLEIQNFIDAYLHKIEKYYIIVHKIQESPFNLPNDCSSICYKYLNWSMNMYLFLLTPRFKYQKCTYEKFLNIDNLFMTKLKSLC